MLRTDKCSDLAAHIATCHDQKEQTRVLEVALRARSGDTALTLQSIVMNLLSSHDRPETESSWLSIQHKVTVAFMRFTQEMLDCLDIIPANCAVVAPEVVPVEVVRDEYGFWRHPCFPVFFPSDPQSRSDWFTDNKLEGCGTFLVAPDESSVVSQYCADWEIKAPPGDKWFLLAIEGTNSGPVAIWAAKAGS